MKAPVKPSNVTVYVKLESVIGPASSGVQFGLGHVCCARNVASDGAVVETWVTVTLPFFAGSVVLVGPTVNVPAFTATMLPPLLTQLTVAVYVVVNVAVAFVLPMPSMSNTDEGQVTVRPVTVHVTSAS